MTRDLTQTEYTEVKRYAIMNMPRCACSLCATCGQSLWVFSGKAGCGNRSCKDFGLAREIES